MIDVAQPDAYNNHHMMSSMDDTQEEDWETGDNSAKLFERSRIKALAAERETVQKKTFCKWVNSHLKLAGCHAQDLYVDLRDGKLLIKLLEVLSGEALPRPTKGKMRIHCLENVDKSLNFLNEQRVHLENVGAQDIVDGSPRLTLGLIWTIILRFQIQDITIEETDTSERRSAKDALLLWCQMKTTGYPNVNIRNFSTSWRDGLAFNALIHKHRSDLLEFNQLNKNNAEYNLTHAFDVAEKNLGISNLLEVEDVNVDCPDEKSIITYVVSYYHFFSKMKAESVQGRRVAKAVETCMSNDKMIDEYETLTSDLLAWIKERVEKLNDHNFENSLTGVKQDLSNFSHYRTTEKPPKFTEKGNLEVQLFNIQNHMRSNNQKPYCPVEGVLVSDVNRAWTQLEKCEHSRELALHQEIMRQEKLEQLSIKFDRKAGMRETWLSENQRLVSQDNFGFDLASVEAATKKHEAIETDINSYEERVQAVMAVSNELEQHKYHDLARVQTRKENVLRLWTYLLELLASRRQRLQLSLDLQKVFQEMLYIFDWIEEIKLRLQSDDHGKHLMGVEDLIQKHTLLESDISAIGERVVTINKNAQKFVDGNFTSVDDYAPCEKGVISKRQTQLLESYEDLLAKSAQRKRELEESKKMWLFYWETADEEQWIKEKEQLMSSPDLGHDLATVHMLISKHRSNEDEMVTHVPLIEKIKASGLELIESENFLSDKIQKRIDDMENNWTTLETYANVRKERLNAALFYHQFFTDADDVNTYLYDTCRLISTDNLGHDEASVLSLIKKHKDICETLANYSTVIDALSQQAQDLDSCYDDDTEVSNRLGMIEKRYAELKELASDRTRSLSDALALYQLFNDAESIEQWIDEKDKLLNTMEPGEDAEDVEILRARFATLELEVKATQLKVDGVNENAEQLLSNDHQNSADVEERQRQLNKRWEDLHILIEQKKRALDISLTVNTWHSEILETMTWITEKSRLIMSTDELGSDLAGVITLQRRLGGLQRDLEAIEVRINSLNKTADEITDCPPEQLVHIQQRRNEANALWDELNNTLKERDNKLGQASDLQRFLQSLDHFQQWLTITQTAIASDDIPSNLIEAEELLRNHQAIRDEMSAYEPEYIKMKAEGEQVIKDGSKDMDYMFLGERINALNDGWEDVHKMWMSKEQFLIQSKMLQTFMRDAKQCEVMLSAQDNILIKEEMPVSLESADDMIKQHEAFLNSLDANDEKINTVIVTGEDLVTDGNYSSATVISKIDGIRDRRDCNRSRATTYMSKLQDALHVQKFLQDCDELTDWCEEKLFTVRDDTYRESKSIHSKYIRHQAFEAEIGSNKERLEKLQHEAELLVEERPSMQDVVEPKIEELKVLWAQLEYNTKEKAEKLFDSKRHVLYTQSCDDIDGWITDIESELITDEVGHDLTTVNLLVQKQNILESQLKIKQQQVGELDHQASHLKKLDPDQEELIVAKKQHIEHRFAKVLEPLAVRRKQLERAKAIHQFYRDIANEKIWVAENMPLATSQDFGNTLLNVQHLLKKNKVLNSNVTNHCAYKDSVIENGRKLLEESSPRDLEECCIKEDDFNMSIQDLMDRWDDLVQAISERQDKLLLSDIVQQYLFDASEAEIWLGEHEVCMMSDERAKDEVGSVNMIKKHSCIEIIIEEYADMVRSLSERSQAIIEEDNEHSAEVASKQAKVDKLYAGLKEMSGVRRLRLADVLRLFELNREIEDIEQWLMEREIVAGSHELGLDFEHITMLREKFAQFAADTETIGQERVAEVNEVCDALIADGHADADTIAEWKDNINELWADVLEQIDTRTQMLFSSYKLHKFHNDCKETLERIKEKEISIPEELGKDAQSVAALQRRHASFENDLLSLANQVQQIQEDSATMIVAYAGNKAIEIQHKEAEVVDAWRRLQITVDYRKKNLNDFGDLFRFYNMVRDLLLWIKDMHVQMGSQEKPRDVSGVELLMNYHQSLKAEIDSRDEKFSIAVALGRDILSRCHPKSQEVRERLISLGTQRGDMMQLWEDRWTHLQLILEVYQFARDAAVADSWLASHEPYLQSHDYGETLDAVEALIKKHALFEKSAEGQKDRFLALERLTNFEIKSREAEALTDPTHKSSSFAQKYVDEFLPPEPVREPTPVEEIPEVEVTTVDSPSSPIQVQETVQQSARRMSEGTHPMDQPEASPVVMRKEPSRKPSKAKRSSKRSSEKKHQLQQGVLIRKHEWESTTRKASNRSWEKVFCRIPENSHNMNFFKDSKHAENDPNTGYRPSLSLIGANASVATDYVKRPNVFRLKLGSGGDYLFQCKDQQDMERWISSLNSLLASGEGTSDPSKAKTMPEQGASHPEIKKRGFFTIGKKR